MGDVAMDGSEDDRGSKPEPYPLAVTRHFPDGQDERVFGFGAPGPEVQSLAAASDTFCVIADPRNLGAPAPTLDPERPSFGNSLWLGEWLAALDLPAQPADPESAPALILKLREGALPELLAQPAKWTAPDAFLPLGEGRQAADYGQAFGARLSDALARSEDPGGLYKDLRQIEGGWGGFLLLGARIGATGLPPGLGFLKADRAIDALGFDFLWSNPGPPQYVFPFGIIDYRGPPAASMGEGPRLELSALQLAIGYSSVRYFRCTLALSLAGGVTLSLAGAYVQRDGRSSYVFSPAGSGEACSLDNGADGARPLEQWLEPLFEGAWLFDTDPAQPLGIGLQGSYSMPLAEAIAPVEMPVLLLTPRPMSGLSPSALARQLGEHIETWRREQAPSTEGAELRFRLTLFSDQGPFVTFPPVGVALAKVSVR